MEILDELPCEAGFLLLSTLRTLELWARADPNDREVLFLEGARQKRLREVEEASVPDAIRPSLTLLGTVLDPPEEIDARALAAACDTLASWAQAAGCFATTHHLLRAAALADPADPHRALCVARSAHARGDVVAAESWLHRAVMLARPRGEWDVYALAHLEIGRTHLSQGRTEAALAAGRRALRAAKRHTVREARGLVHRRMAELAHDLAYLWLTDGHHRAALRVFESVRPLLVERSPEWLCLVANTARAAAGCGRGDAFSAARAECLELCRLLGEPMGAAGALLEVAHGAAILGDGVEARALAARAATLATRHGEARERAVADTFLSEDRLPGASSLGEEEPVSVPEVELLASELSLALEECAMLRRN